MQEALKANSTEKLAEFINKKMRTIFNRIKEKELKKTISYFGKNAEEKFQTFVDNDNRNIMQKYKNFIENRHNAAHSNISISISWEEVKNIDEIGEKIINAVQYSLSLS